MKVLFVVFEFQGAVSGGIARVVNGLAPELARSTSLHVLWVFGSRWRRRRFQLYDFSPGGLALERGAAALDTPENLVRLVEREGYEVVHFFCVNPIMTEKVEALEARLPDVKIVFSVHNLFEHEKAIRRTTDELLREERRTLALVDHVHVLNRAGLHRLSTSYPSVVSSKPISVIANGLADEGFIPRDDVFRRGLVARTRDHAAVISCMSRWAPGKGLELLIAAVAELVRRGEDVCLVLAGRKPRSWEVGAKEYVRTIDRLVAPLGSRAVVLGWLDDAQRNVLFDLTDVFVMPSQLEYFAYASFEPLHEGVPVVQSRLDCLLEYLTDGEHCVFFEPGDAADLTEKLLGVLRDGQRAAQIAARGRERVRALFHWSPIAEQYLAMYAGLSRAGRASTDRATST